MSLHLGLNRSQNKHTVMQSRCSDKRPSVKAMATDIKGEKKFVKKKTFCGVLGMEETHIFKSTTIRPYGYKNPPYNAAN